MGYGIHRIEKIKKGGCGAIGREHTREQLYISSDVDKSRSGENITLIDKTNGADFGRYIDQELTAVGCRVRKDSVLMLDALYTASPDWLQHRTKEQQLNYFQDCLKWHEQQYGAPFYAVVHMDESTPHMHVCSVPLQEREGRKVLTAKSIIGNRRDMSRRQESFWKECCQERGLQHHQIRTATHEKREHLSLLEYKISQESEKLQQQHEKLMPEPEVLEIPKKAALFQKSKVVVDSNDLEQLQIQAGTAVALERERQRLLNDTEQLKKGIMDSIEDEIDSLQQRLEILQSRERQKSEAVRLLDGELQSSPDMQRLQAMHKEIETAAYGGIFTSQESRERAAAADRIVSQAMQRVRELWRDLPEKNRELERVLRDTKTHEEYSR